MVSQCKLVSGWGLEMETSKAISALSLGNHLADKQQKWQDQKRLCTTFALGSRQALTRLRLWHRDVGLWCIWRGVDDLPARHRRVGGRRAKRHREWPWWSRCRHYSLQHDHTPKFHSTQKTPTTRLVDDYWLKWGKIMHKNCRKSASHCHLLSTPFSQTMHSFCTCWNTVMSYQNVHRFTKMFIFLNFFLHIVLQKNMTHHNAEHIKRRQP